MSDFSELIESLLPKYGNTKQHLAEAIGMTPSGFGRGVEKNTLSVENLLRLAKETRTDPSRILRAGGKGAVADLIEEMYGGSHTPTLTAEERALVSDWNRLGGSTRESLRAVIRELLKRGGQRSRRTA